MYSPDTKHRLCEGNQLNLGFNHKKIKGEKEEISID